MRPVPRRPDPRAIGRRGRQRPVPQRQPPHRRAVKLHLGRPAGRAERAGLAGVDQHVGQPVAGGDLGQPVGGESLREAVQRQRHAGAGEADLVLGQTHVVPAGEGCGGGLGGAQPAGLPERLHRRIERPAGGVVDRASQPQHLHQIGGGMGEPPERVQPHEVRAAIERRPRLDGAQRAGGLGEEGAGGGRGPAAHGQRHVGAERHALPPVQGRGGGRAAERRQPAGCGGEGEDAAAGGAGHAAASRAGRGRVKTGHSAAR